jgi:hypothetical protein
MHDRSINNVARTKRFLKHYLHRTEPTVEGKPRPPVMKVTFRYARSLRAGRYQTMVSLIVRSNIGCMEDRVHSLLLLHYGTIRYTELTVGMNECSLSLP